MSAPVLSVEGLVAGYERDLPILRGVSLVVREGEIVTLLGANGAGKSTLVKAIAGLVPVSRGRVLLRGTDIAAVPAHRRIRLGLAFVPQTDNVFANLTVRENLELAGFFLGRARAARIAAMDALFPDLARQRDLPAGRLSGGQRQMLAIARALAVGPGVLMLDEPSAGLSPRMVGVVFEKLRAIREQGVTILMVEQNAKAALALADRAYVMAEGRERLEGPAAAIAGSDALRALYLGEAAA